MYTFYDKALKEHQRLTEKLTEIKNQLSSLPEGNLFCATQGKYTKWYVTTKSACTYIPKKKRLLAEKLALKKLLLLQKKEIEQEKTAIDFYLRHHKSDTNSTFHHLTTKPEYAELLYSQFIPLDQELTEWSNAPYEKNTSHPEQLQYKTSSGLTVRSKSETLIELLLRLHKIPFRYECALKLNEIVLYPDFTIRHPTTGEFFYWEHFGLMDDSSYQKNAFSKLRLYASHGILPTINLITTYETKDHPLNAEYIELLIKQYFL